MNFPLVIVGSLMIFFGSILTIIGTNWDKINKKKPESSEAQGYTLKANMNVMNQNVHIEGLNVKGNVNFSNADGSSLKEAIVSEDKDNKGSGNLNINNSKIANINDNKIKNNTNINNSEIENLNRNKIGNSE